MLELLILSMFLSLFIFTGLSMAVIIIMILATTSVVFLMGMIGFVIKLMPFLVVVVIGLWGYKYFIAK